MSEPKKSWVPKPIADAIDQLAKYPLIVAVVVLGALFAVGITLASGAPGYGMH